MFGHKQPFLLQVLFVCLAVFCASACLYAIDQVVKTESGLVRGAGTDVVVFKGIPFAAPPVGPLRWKAPQPALSLARNQGRARILRYLPSASPPSRHSAQAV